MNILTKQIENGPTIEMVSSRILRDVQMSFSQVLNMYARGVDQVWDNPRFTPAEIVTALGTDAVEVFTLHGALGNLLESVKPGCTATFAAKIGDFTPNADGTIVVV